MGDGTSAQRFLVTVNEAGRRREFVAADLPLTFGAAGADVLLAGVPGTVQIGRLGETFFVHAGRGARNVRVDGEQVAGSRELRDGDVIAFDRARLGCRLAGGVLTVDVRMQVAAGDTVPPNLEEVEIGRAHV